MPNPLGLSRRQFLLATGATLGYCCLENAWGEANPSGWQKFAVPTTDSGLVLQPRLTSLRGRATLFWAGTSSEARAPEVFFCSSADGDDGWQKSRAPFFGNDMGRVRRLAVATARDAMALIFQRETTQGNGAVEVLLSLSKDNGYSFSNPFVMDSYVLGEEGGSYLSIAARQGTQRPEFAAAWVAEGGQVRACSIDPRTGFRPQTRVLGEVKSIHSKVEVIGAGQDGFYAIWAEGRSMKSAFIKPLTGTIDEAVSFASGDFQRNFCGASYYRGPGYVVAAAENGDFQVYALKDRKFTALGSKAKFPVSGRKLDCRADLEGRDHLHMAVLDEGKVPRLLYTTNRSGNWSAPDTICDLKEAVTVTGFDIAVTEGYAWAIVTQSQLLNIFRRKI